MTLVTGITLAVSIASLIISLLSLYITNKRNKITKDTFNVSRIKGESNRKFWKRTIAKFVIKNNEYINMPKDISIDDKEVFDKYLTKKYYILLEMAYSGELKTDNVQEVIELLFAPRLKQDYWEHKKELKHH